MKFLEAMFYLLGSLFFVVGTYFLLTVPIAY